MEAPTDAGCDPGELKEQEEAGITGTGEGHEAREIVRPGQMEVRLVFIWRKGQPR